jgi:hypothetical protein
MRLTSIQGTRSTYPSEARLDELESTHVHGVPKLMNVKLDIARFDEFAEREFL